MAGFVGDSRRLKGRQEELQNGQVCKVKATRRWVEQVNLQNERFATTYPQCVYTECFRADDTRALCVELVKRCAHVCLHITPSGLSTLGPRSSLGWGIKGEVNLPLGRGMVYRLTVQ